MRSVPKSCTKIALAACLLLASGPVAAGRAVTYFAPATNLEALDLAWLHKALQARRLYVAMYAFTDKPLARALLQLARAGVLIGLYRDGRQMHERGDVTWMLVRQPNIQIRASDSSRFIMHDKMFIIPGVVFREGSANWSPVGEGATVRRGRKVKQQDNAATYITDRSAIRAATQNFIRIWYRKSNAVLR